MRVHNPADHAQGRFAELDGLRGVAVGAVVVYHYTSPFDGYFPGHPAAPFDFVEGAYGVQLFFLISGFVILLTAQRSRRPTDFLIARATRLYPTYWAALTITLVCIWATNQPVMAVTPTQAAVNYTMLQRFVFVENVDRAYWTLAVELVFYGLMFLLLLATAAAPTERQLTRCIAAWLAVTLVVSLLVGSNEPGLAQKVLLNVTIAEYGPLFAAGMLAYLSRSDGRLRGLYLPAGAVAVVNATLLHSAYDGLIVAIVFLGFSCVVFLPAVPALAKGPLQLLGRISYPLYLIHQVVGMLIIELLIGRIGRVPAMVAAAVVVVGIATLLHRSVEGPGSRWLRRRLIQLRDRVSR